eukprot:TRINITY_DN17121_c0_g1_i1.p1 TRINITY_DN17121_c0_g1~~TRINITY_DN17121_c0_g1_i1.p1  ORF type:complete len:353 (+),score=60.51 TRINITY_DN17121_c0_g1_i1:111-1169(+)
MAKSWAVRAHTQEKQCSNVKQQPPAGRHNDQCFPWLQDAVRIRARLRCEGDRVLQIVQREVSRSKGEELLQMLRSRHKARGEGKEEDPVAGCEPFLHIGHPDGASRVRHRLRSEGLQILQVLGPRSSVGWLPRGAGTRPRLQGGVDQKKPDATDFKNTSTKGGANAWNWKAWKAQADVDSRLLKKPQPQDCKNAAKRATLLNLANQVGPSTWKMQADVALHSPLGQRPTVCKHFLSRATVDALNHHDVVNQHLVESEHATKFKEVAKEGMAGAWKTESGCDLPFLEVPRATEYKSAPMGALTGIQTTQCAGDAQLFENFHVTKFTKVVQEDADGASTPIRTDVSRMTRAQTA